MADLQDVRNQNPDDKNIEEMTIILNTYKQAIADLQAKVIALEGN